jgi:predicted nucleotidyltransferase
MISINLKQKQKISEAAEKHGLVFVVLYGSHARGKARPESDVDIAALGEKPISFNKLAELNNEFAEIFETKEIDVKSLNRTDPLFRQQVTRDGILLFGDRHEYNRFRAYAFRDYVDSRSLFKLKDILIGKRLKDLSA